MFRPLRRPIVRSPKKRKCDFWVQSSEIYSYQDVTVSDPLHSQGSSILHEIEQKALKRQKLDEEESRAIRVSSTDVPVSSKAISAKDKKDEKKYREIAQMLRRSDKFYKEVKTPRPDDKQVQNAIKVLMSRKDGISMSDGGYKLFQSWPEYCKQNRFISKLSGGIPDMILPSGGEFLDVQDVKTNSLKGKTYQMQSGLKKMTQVRRNYFVLDVESAQKVDASSSEGGGQQTSEPKTKSKAQKSIANVSDGDETMSSDEETLRDQLLQRKGINFQKRFKKDKTLMCKRCDQGGHVDVNCPVRKEEKLACHICYSNNNEHDTFCCPLVEIRCEKCSQVGHIEKDCKIGELQLHILKMNSWDNGQQGTCDFNQIKQGMYTHYQKVSYANERYTIPSVKYRPVVGQSQALEFNYDRVINTELRKLLRLAQEQGWIKLKVTLDGITENDFLQKQDYFEKTLKIINEDYLRREQKKFRKGGIKYFDNCPHPTDEVDLESPPLPDDHYPTRLYCSWCTRNHHDSECKNGRRPNMGDAKADWSAILDAGAPHMRGKARRMYRFRQAPPDRNQTRLGHESREKRKQIEEEAQQERQEMQKEQRRIEEDQMIMDDLKRFQQVRQPSQSKPDWLQSNEDEAPVHQRPGREQQKPGDWMDQLRSNDIKHRRGTINQVQDMDPDKIERMSFHRAFDQYHNNGNTNKRRRQPSESDQESILKRIKKLQ